MHKYLNLIGICFVLYLTACGTSSSTPIWIKQPAIENRDYVFGYSFLTTANLPDGVSKAKYNAITNLKRNYVFFMERVAVDLEKSGTKSREKILSYIDKAFSYNLNSIRVLQKEEKLIRDKDYKVFLKAGLEKKVILRTVSQLAEGASSTYVQSEAFEAIIYHEPSYTFAY